MNTDCPQHKAVYEAMQVEESKDSPEAARTDTTVKKEEVEDVEDGDIFSESSFFDGN